MVSQKAWVFSEKPPLKSAEAPQRIHKTRDNFEMSSLTMKIDSSFLASCNVAKSPETSHVVCLSSVADEPENKFFLLKPHAQKSVLLHSHF